MQAPIYHNLPSERIYQNVPGPPRAIRRTDSSLKRRIARKNSFPSAPSSSALSKTSVDNNLLRSIIFPSVVRSKRPEPVKEPPRRPEPAREPPRRPEPATRRPDSRDPQRRGEWPSKQPSRFSIPQDLQGGRRLQADRDAANWQRLDTHKLEAVLRFMEANNIDPYLPPERPAPRGLRRNHSERRLGGGEAFSSPMGNSWSSMERLPREKKRRKSFSLPFGNRSEDIEYGPGIVEKLKAKFSKLSSGLTKETRSRRSPSVDELNNHDYEPIRHMEAPMLAKRHSKSTNDIYEQEEPRTYTIHRVVAVDQDEDSVDAPCISTLRRKFETSAERASRLRPVSTDLSQVRDFSLHTSSLTYDAPPPRGLRLVEADPIVVVATRNNNITSPLMSPLPVASPLLSPAPVAVTPVPVKEAVVEPTRRLRVLEVLNQAESEPEFVKIGRRLRKSAAPPPDLFENTETGERRNVEFRTEVIEKPEVPAPDYEPHYDHYEPQAPVTRVERPVVVETPVITTIIETPKAPPPRKFIIRGEAHLPTISGNFRVIRETSSHSYDLPPDPEPANHITSAASAPPPPVVHHYQPPPIAAPQGSPPPEEPRPSRPAVEPEVPSQPCLLCENSQPQLTVPVVVAKTETTTTTAAKNDGEGITEVQRLLSRFQMSRTSRGVFEVPQEEMRTFSSSTVVGMRSVDVTPAPPRPATGAGRVNVVSISVRSDAPSVITTSQNSTDGVSPTSAPTPSKRMAPSPPEESLSPPLIETQPPLLSHQPSVVEEQRKSLSSQYLEEKARRERPYGDDVTELKTEPRESSVDEEEVEVPVVQAPVAPVVAPPTSLIQDSESSASEDSESEENFYNIMPTRPFTLSFSEPMFAGDGNPVRHTLLSLVMEEDIPMLMEAMQEKHNFVFEDLHERPSTSSIIHPLETRKLRRQQRKVSSIKFREEAPQVYTYLDEMTAEASQHWQEGALLDYDAYQRMLEVEQEELDQSLSELARWRQGVGRSWEDAASQNGLVNSFNSLPDPSTISV